MAKYTITGATGYLGHQMLTKLAADDNNYIYAIVRKDSNIKTIKDNVEYIIYDGSEVALEHAIENSDHIIHFGALYDTRKDAGVTKNLIMSNILFSTQIFNVAERLNPAISIVSASTFSALNEHQQYQPSTLYAASKRAVEDLACAYNLPIHFLTLPDTCGPDDWRPKIHNILKKHKGPEPFEFRSGLSQEMRIMHVEDVIGHALSVLENKENGVHIYDIYATAELITLRDLGLIVTEQECVSTTDSVVKIPKQAREVSKLTGYENKYKSFKLFEALRD